MADSSALLEIMCTAHASKTLAKSWMKQFRWVVDLGLFSEWAPSWSCLFALVRRIAVRMYGNAYFFFLFVIDSYSLWFAFWSRVWLRNSNLNHLLVCKFCLVAFSLLFLHFSLWCCSGTTYSMHPWISACSRHHACFFNVNISGGHQRFVLKSCQLPETRFLFLSLEDLCGFCKRLWLIAH